MSSRLCLGRGLGFYVGSGADNEYILDAMDLRRIAATQASKRLILAFDCEPNGNYDSRPGAEYQAFLILFGLS